MSWYWSRAYNSCNCRLPRSFSLLFSLVPCKPYPFFVAHMPEVLAKTVTQAVRWCVLQAQCSPAVACMPVQHRVVTITCLAASFAATAGHSRKLRVTANPNITIGRVHVPFKCQLARVVLLGPLTLHDVDARSFVQFSGACEHQCECLHTQHNARSFCSLLQCR